MNHATRLVTAALLGGTLVGGLTACRDDRSDQPPRQFFPDMDDGPKWKPQAQSEFFADGRTMRLPPAGTVPFGRSSEASAAAWSQTGREGFVHENAAVVTGMVGDDYVATSPIPITAELIKRGQERFNIYCAVCHGYTAAGGQSGMVGRSYTIIPANLLDAKYQDPNEPTQRGDDGFLYHITMVGVRNPQTGALNMPGYSHALSPEDGWAVVAYIRALQQTKNGSVGDVPENMRADLERRWPGGANPAPVATPSSAAVPSAPASSSPASSAPVSSSPAGGTK